MLPGLRKDTWCLAFTVLDRWFSFKLAGLIKRAGTNGLFKNKILWRSERQWRSENKHPIERQYIFLVSHCHPVVKMCYDSTSAVKSEIYFPTTWWLGHNMTDKYIWKLPLLLLFIYIYFTMFLITIVRNCLLIRYNFTSMLIKIHITWAKMEFHSSLIKFLYP